ncbi:MAG TPA: toast rack family protein [Candidatus Acidoferrum sp.]|nr:toast rack family protein [Candidatus Acidoferrum sp.]
MKRKWLLVAAGVLILAAAVSVVAARIVHKTETVAAKGAKSLDVKCTFGAGKLSISPSAMEDAARLDIDYAPDRVDYDVSYDVRGETGHLTMESDHRSHIHMDSDDNSWDATFSTRYPMALILKIGATEADMDLGGIPLTDASIEIGAASGKLDFSAPNPKRCRDLKFEAGASSLKISHLGNASFDFMKFSGGAGAFTVDFRGEYHGESNADIEIGLGSADIIVPRELPVRIETDGDNWFSSVDVHGGDVDEIHKGVYESPDYAKATDRLRLKLDVGLGSVDLYFK